MSLLNKVARLDQIHPNDLQLLTQISYLSRSERYYDDIYEYRHVVLPPEIAKRVPKGRLMSEVRPHPPYIKRMCLYA